MQKLRRLFQILACLGLVLYQPLVNASQVDDIRILIDVSGSMQRTDPHNLRVPALRMLNGMIPTGSNAGVWTFGRYVNMEVKWGKVNDAWRKQADKGASRIHSKGQYTNIESALARASNGWSSPDPAANRNIIILTDGKVDISKNADKNAQSRDNLIKRTLPKLVKNGIKVHTIALSRFTDEDLLKRIALTSGGSFEMAETAEDLQRIFLRMFERATKPDTVTLKENKFIIDKSVREMTLLVFRKKGKPTRLRQPDKVLHSQSKHGSNISWRNDQGYDLITVKKPSVGEWTLDADIDPDNRVMIVTDLKLQVNELPAYSTPDKALELQVELHSRDKKISKNSFLKFVGFKVIHNVAEQSQTLPLKLKKSRDIKDKGIYLQRLETPLSEGTHEFIVSADARTFNRSRRISVEVQWPVEVEINKADKAGEYRLLVTPRPEYIKADTLQLEVSLRQPDQQKLNIEMQQKFDHWVGDIKANQHTGLHQIMINMKAQGIDGTKVSHQLDGYSILGVKLEDSEPAVNEITTKPDQPAADEALTDSLETKDISDKEVDRGELIKTIIIIALVNGIILIIAAVVYFVLRKKKARDDYDLFGDEKPGDEKLGDGDD